MVASKDCTWRMGLHLTIREKWRVGLQVPDSASTALRWTWYEEAETGGWGYSWLTEVASEGYDQS